MFCRLGRKITILSLNGRRINFTNHNFTHLLQTGAQVNSRDSEGTCGRGRGCQIVNFTDFSAELFSSLEKYSSKVGPSVDFWLFTPMLPLIFGGKTRKMLVDHPKYEKIWVDFFIILEKSVEFFAPNTDWPSFEKNFIIEAQKLRL